MDFKEKVDKEFEGKTAAEILTAPISALQGVSENDARKMKESFGIDNVKEMADLKYYKIALAIKKEAGK
jgi:hypothetical protein